MTRKKHENRTGRHRRSVLLVALTTAVLATLLLATGVGTAGAISGCTTINSPGGYTLDSGVSDSDASSCINITSSNVVLDGQESTIDGNVTAGTVGINVTDATTTLSNVTVRNVTVTDWARGIEYADVSGGNITNVNTTLNEGPQILVDSISDNVTIADSEVFRDRSTRAGIEFEGDDSKVRNNTIDGNYDPIYVTGDGNVVESNVVTDEGGTAGITVRLGDDNVVRNNDLDVDFRGVNIDSGVNNTVQSNSIDILDAFGTSKYGMEVSGGSASDNKILDNTLSLPNTGKGVIVDSASDTLLRNNTITNAGAEGVLVDGATGTTLTNITVRDASDAFAAVSGSEPTATGFDIGPSTKPNTTLNFTAQDIRLDASPSAPADPSGEQNIGRYADATNTSATASFLNVTFQYRNSDTSGVDKTTLDVWKYNGTWTELGTGPATDPATNEIQYNITNVGSVFAPLAGPEAGVGAPGAGGECINRRNIGRGQEDQECPRDRGLGRGESREDLDRATGRNSDTSRRDRGRDERGRGR
jgi:parallel beta-helix repeat protein